MDSPDPDADSCLINNYQEPSLLFSQISSFFESDSLSQSDLDAVLKSLDNYQELPQLLDSYLFDCVQQCSINYFNQKTTPDNNRTPKPNQLSSSWPCQIIYTLAKVRGPKTVAKFFPSDVNYLLELVSRLESLISSKQSFPNSEYIWQEHYTLLLWLSVSVLAPFPLSTFGESTFDRIYKVSQHYLKVPGKERDAAALLVARLVTRQDAKTLGGLFQFLTDVKYGVSNSSVFYKLGALAAISHICKLLNPTEIYLNLHLRTNLLVSFLLEQSKSVVGAVQDKLVVKCLSKIGASLVLVDIDDFAREKVEITDPSELLELVFEYLTNSLQNPNSVVRYTAAKAVASITSTLPQEFQENVLQSCLSTFDLAQADDLKESALEAVPIDRWHGELLLLAEMIRRKIRLYSVEEDNDGGNDSTISCSIFDQLLRILQLTLRLEQQKLTRTLGAPIRDASCYVCWSLFRSPSLWIPHNASSIDSDSGINPAYSKDFYIPIDFVQSLATALISTSCFDREINVRRAAAAALQEGIGRLPSSSVGIPAIHNGLALVVTLDFSRVSVIEKAFTKVFPEVYNLGYTQTLDYVIKYTIQSSSSNVRKLAANAISILLQQLMATDLELCRQTVQKIIKIQPKVSNLYAFHGVYFTIAQILIDCGPVLFQNGTQDSSDLLVKVIDLISVGEIQYGDVEIQEVYLHLLLGALKNEHQVAADTRLNHAYKLLQVVLATDSKVARDAENEDLEKIARLLPVESIYNFTDFLAQAKHEIESSTVNTTIQKSMGIKPCNTCYFVSHCASLPKSVVLDLFYKPIVMPKAVFRNRQVATQCLWNIINHDLGILLTDNETGKVIDTSLLQVFINGLFDYTADSRGDVGSWLRKTCILAGRQICQSKAELLKHIKNETNLEYSKVKLERFQEIYTTCCIRISGELLDNLRNECVVSLSQSLYPAISQYFTGFLKFQFEHSTTGNSSTFIQYTSKESPQSGSLIQALCKDEPTPHVFVCAFIKGLVFSAGAQQASAGILESACAALYSILDPSAAHFKSLLNLSCKQLWRFISALVYFGPPTNLQLQFSQDLLFVSSKSESLGSFESLLNLLSLTTPRLALAALGTIDRVLSTGIELPQDSFDDHAVVSNLSKRIIRVTSSPVPLSTDTNAPLLSRAHRALLSKLVVSIPVLLVLSNRGDASSLFHLISIAQVSAAGFAQVQEQAMTAVYDTLVISRALVIDECVMTAKEAGLIQNNSEHEGNDDIIDNDDSEEEISESNRCLLKSTFKYVWQTQLDSSDETEIESILENLVDEENNNGSGKESDWKMLEQLLKQKLN